MKLVLNDDCEIIDKINTKKIDIDVVDTELKDTS